MISRFARRFLAAAGLAFAAASAMAQGTIVIAQVAPFSGPLAGNGLSNYIGAKAYFDQVNAAGGVAGRKIKFIREDDTYKPAETVRLMRLVAERDRPAAFVNVLGSANVTALLKEKVFDAIDVPAVGVTPGTEELRNPGHPLLFHVVGGDRSQIETVLNHLRTVGATRIGVVYQDIPFGTNGLAIAEEVGQKLGVKIVGKLAVPRGADDVKGLVKPLAAMGAQTYLIILAPNSGAAFVRDIRLAGDRTPIYSLSYVTARGVTDAAGVELATGVAVAQVTPNPAVPNSGLVRDFQQAMKAHAPKDAEYSSATLVGYLAARTVVEGLKQTKGEGGSALAAALRKLRLDLGGYMLDFPQGGGAVGSRMVDIAVISRAGTLRY